MANETLNDILDIAEELQTPVKEEQALVPAESVDGEIVAANPAPVAESAENQNLEQDFEYGRIQLKNIIELGQDAAEQALALAKTGDSAKPYEAVATLIQATVNASKELIELHRTRRDTREINAPATSDTPGTSVTNIDKAVFVGRASDLLRELNALKKQIE